jgi:hypothetical protein
MSSQLKDGLTGRKSFPWDLHVCLPILFVVVESYSLLRPKKQDDAQKKRTGQYPIVRGRTSHPRWGGERDGDKETVRTLRVPKLI